VTSEGLVEQLGLLGVFIAGATPWLAAITVIPVGILIWPQSNPDVPFRYRGECTDGGPLCLSQ